MGETGATKGRICLERFVSPDIILLPVWLPLGGYRIGIRSPHGGYFYYAHLSGYEANIRKGQTVAAGDILGYMGNTGYGSEGTRGKFPVHLHLGIYIEVPFQKELSVNPYWLLKIFEKKIRNYTY